MPLSVIVPAYNEERYLPETLSSPRTAIASCRCGVEVIVVDNASEDRTADVARDDIQVLPSPRRFDQTPRMADIDLNQPLVHCSFAKDKGHLGRLVP